MIKAYIEYDPIRSMIEDEVFFEELKRRLRLSELDEPVKANLKEEKNYSPPEPLLQNKAKSTDGHTGRDFNGEYSNAWIDSGDGSWWIDENGNEHTS